MATAAASLPLARPHVARPRPRARSIPALWPAARGAWGCAARVSPTLALYMESGGTACASPQSVPARIQWHRTGQPDAELHTSSSGGWPAGGLALAAAARRCGAGPPRRSATWSPSCLRRPLVRARPTLLSTAPQRCAGAPPPPPVATPWETLGWSLGAAAGAVSRLHDSARHASLLLAALRPRPCRRRRCRRLYAFLGLSSPALPARPTVPCGGLQPLLPLGPGNSYSTLVHAMYGRPACSCGRLANPEGAHPPAQPRASRPACSC